MMLAEMAPYLLLGFFFAGLLRAFVPKSIYRKHLAPRNMKSVVKAALLGIPLPLCSCGVIPTSVGLRREGASHGACTSFLIATPQTGVDSIAATYSLMGLPFAIVRPIAALFTSMFGGWLVNKFANEDETLSEETTRETAECNCDQQTSPSFWNNFISAMRYAFVEMLQDVGKWLVVGLLIAALITVAVPNEWLAALHDYKLLNMLIVLAVAIPMYVCATGSIPIAVSLMAKGLTPGAALVLLMAGPAVNSASMLVVGKVFGRRTLRLYLTAIITGAVVFGLCIDYLLPQQWFKVSGMIMSGGHCAHCLGTMDWVWMTIFLLLLANAFVDRLRHSWMLRREKSKEEGEKQNIKEGDTVSDITIYDVKEMACNHCKANVEKIISGIAGVESVEVDLVKGIAYVHGQHDHSEVERQVTANGYPTTLKV
jgi:uncharacterized membrane protein YraQ (UPF0718 family)/copper chaperone CopZ